MKSGSDIPDEEAVAEEIEKMLVEAWKKFFGYYKEKAPKYRESWPLELNEKLNEKDAKDSHWICWDEYDLMFHIGRFFYDILRKKKEEKFSNIEIHFEKMVNSNNFKDYKFEDRDWLEKLKGKLDGKEPKVDMIIAYEDKNSPFLLCAEVKCLHYGTTPIELIRADTRKLKAIRELGIAKRAVFMLFDDYYWYKRGRKTVKKIEDELDKIKKEENDIKVLYYKSEAKMCEFRPDC